MERYLKALLALCSILGAGLLLVQAVRLIEKNTPSEKKIHRQKSAANGSCFDSLKRSPVRVRIYWGGWDRRACWRGYCHWIPTSRRR